MMTNKPFVLFIYLNKSSFVNEDLRILNRISTLSAFNFKPSRSPFSLAMHFIQQFFWLMKNISKADVIYCWFADYHGFLPAMFAKISGTPLLTVLGGFDCNKNETLNYGLFSSKWRAPLGKFTIRNSTLLLPVNKTLIETDEVAKHWPSAHPNGLSENIDHFDTPWKELPTGYDSTFWDFTETERKKSVVTVAFIQSIRTAYVKGVDLIIESARNLPDFSFQIIGISESMKDKLNARFDPPANIEFKKSVPREQLLEYYQKASVYVQPSRTEGLPNVLCEAMLCGCVPVGSPVFGIPDCIGDTGYLADEPDPKQIAELIETAHKNARSLRPKTRERILQNFTLEKREDDLKEIISRF